MTNHLHTVNLSISQKMVIQFCLWIIWYRLWLRHLFIDLIILAYSPPQPLFNPTGIPNYGSTVMVQPVSTQVIIVGGCPACRVRSHISNHSFKHQLINCKYFLGRNFRRWFHLFGLFPCNRMLSYWTFMLLCNETKKMS